MADLTPYSGFAGLDSMVRRDTYWSGGMTLEAAQDGRVGGEQHPEVREYMTPAPLTTSSDTRSHCSAILKGQTCCRETGNWVCSPEFGSSRFHRRRPDTGPRGQLFDIVKMEERETWTARFLRNLPGPRLGGFNRLRRCTFLRGIQQYSAEMRQTVVCPRQ